MSENGSSATRLATEGDRRRARSVTRLVAAVDVPGIPAGQGSMHLARVASGKEIARYPTNTVNHRNLAIELLRAAWQREPLEGAVAVRCVFTFPRPASHYLPANRSRPARALRPEMPEWHTGARDVDKMQRLIGDALTIAGVVRDDGQIVAWRAEKPYGDAGLTVVEIFAIDDDSQ